MDTDSTTFQDMADAWLNQMFEILEAEDDEAVLDIDLEEGIMTIDVDEDNTFVISKHAPSKQLWLSSPLSGGLHFDATDGGTDWSLQDGRRLSVVLAEELQQLTGHTFTPNVLQQSA